MCVCVCVRACVKQADRILHYQKYLPSFSLRNSVLTALEIYIYIYIYIYMCAGEPQDDCLECLQWIRTLNEL